MPSFVKEFSCPTCGLTIEKRMKKAEGIRNVRTSIMLNRVFVDYVSSRISLNEIHEAVARAGHGNHPRILAK